MPLSLMFSIANVIEDIRDFLNMQIHFNLSKFGQNDSHFVEEIFKCIFIKGLFCIMTKISLKFVPNDTVENMSALVQMMDWGS